MFSQERWYRLSTSLGTRYWGGEAENEDEGQMAGVIFNVIHSYSALPVLIHLFRLQCFGSGGAIQLCDLNQKLRAPSTT